MRLAVALVFWAATIDAAPTTMKVTATAYCDQGTTKSGTKTRAGIVAADPRVLPVGTVLRILDGPHSGVYTVMDTGSAVKGRRIDIFMASCATAEQFGERPLRIRIIRHGWDPKATDASSSY